MLKTKRKFISGWVSVELSIVMMVGAALTAASTALVYPIAHKYLLINELSFHLKDTFDALELHYRESVSQSANNCLSITPANIDFAGLRARYDVVDYSESWIDSGSETYSFESNTSGLTNKMTIELPLATNLNREVYSSQNNFFGFTTTDSVIYKRKIQTNVGKSNWLYLNSHWCEQ